MLDIILLLMESYQHVLYLEQFHVEERERERGRMREGEREGRRERGERGRENFRQTLCSRREAI